MATITSYLAKRAAVSIEPYHLNDVIEARAAILYHPWDISANKKLADDAVAVTSAALEVLRVFPPLGDS